MRGEADPLPELSLQYADYAVWQRQVDGRGGAATAGGVLGADAGGSAALLELPTDHARPAEQEYAGGWVKLELDEDSTGA